MPSGEPGPIPESEAVPAEEAVPEDEGEAEEEAEQTAEPSEEPSQPGGGGGGIGVNGAVGAAVIDGEMYQFFSLRPDISLWRFGVGLDLSFYFDRDGNLREEDWDGLEDIVDKIYYLRYGKPGEPLYARVGSIDNITLGYGLIMRRYSNAIEWPQVRRVGMHTQIKQGGLTVEGLVNNFSEMTVPGLVGGRISYEKRFMLPVVVGGTFVHDGNQYLGAKDDDDDGIPNPFDLFPDDNDSEHIIWLNTILQPSEIDALIESGDLPDINNPAPNFKELDEEISIWGADIGVALIRKRSVSLWLYGQMAQVVGSEGQTGRGIGAPGLTFNLGPFRAGGEYRIFEREFMPEFFNLGYEVERVVWDEDSNDYVTKKSRLTTLVEKSQGYYADAGLMIYNLFDIYAAYQSLNYEGGGTINSFFAKGSVNAAPIPKLGLAEAYYQQPDADKLFESKSDGTTIGYRIGIEMGGGMMVVVDNKTIYRSGMANKIMTIETQFAF